jgi:DNA-binding protein YbaB
MVSFKQAKDMFLVQREAKRIKRELRTIHVEAEASGVKVIVAADQEIIGIEIAEDVPRDQIGTRLIDALNRAFKKVQVISSEKMQPVMESMGMQNS